MSAVHLPQQNHLLRALPFAARKRVIARLDLVQLPVGRMLYGAAEAENTVHFPTDAVVASLHAAKNDATVQIAVIGNEGMAGCALFVAGEAAVKQTVVQCAGHAFRLSGEALREECTRSTEFYGQLLRYTQGLIAQMAATVACNLKHPLEQRLCRWLLSTLDRVRSNRLPIEQEVLEKVMGEPRERISATLHAFDALGVIQRSAGLFTVPDRRRLERASCACYSTVRREVEAPYPQQAAKLIDAFPELTIAVVDALSASNQTEFAQQLRDALVRGVNYDPDADAASISLAAVYSPRALKQNVNAATHGRKIPLECRFWVNLATDNFGRVTAIEIMHPPAPLREELLAGVRL